MAMTLVSSVTVGSGGAASIEWTNIAQTGKDLMVMLSGRSASTSAEVANIYFNSDTTANNYPRTFLEAYAGSFGTLSNASIGNVVVSGSSQLANTFGSTRFYLANYTSSENKLFMSDAISANNSASQAIRIIGGRRSNTAAITTITLTPDSGNFAQHTSASLYIIS